MSLSRNHQHYPPFLQDTMLVEQSIYISKYCQQGPDPGTNPGRIGPCRQSSLKKPLTFQRETDFHIGFICTIAFLLESKCFPSGDLKYDLCSPHFFIFHPLSGGRNGSLIQALLGGDFKLCCLINSTASVLISLY